jgi:hypothetical protein
MKKFMIMAAMLSFAAACGGNTQNEKSEETVETVETVEVVETVETEAVATPEVAVEEKAEELPAIAPENENLKVQMPEKDKFTVSEIKEVKKIESIKMGDKNEKKALKVSDKTLETPGVQSTNLTVKK